MTTALSINLNKIALIRNSRDTEYPSVVEHAAKCIEFGADGITVHPRPDQRHIRADDCYALADFLKQQHPTIEFNIEGNPFAPAMVSSRKNVSDYPGFMAIIRTIKPAQCTLVPDSNEQLTSDHGFDLRKDTNQLKAIIEECQSLGCRVSLFMDPDKEQLRLAKDIGADRIEFYTGPYADAHLKGDASNALALFTAAGDYAAEIGLEVNAGHDLNLHNLKTFVSNVPNVLEVSIGHAFTVDAIELGLKEAVKRYQVELGNLWLMLAK